MDLKQALEYIDVLEELVEKYESSVDETVLQNAKAMKELRNSLLKSEALTRADLVDTIMRKQKRIRKLQLQIVRLKHGSKSIH